MARKDNSRIVTMFIEANWVTASKAGIHVSYVGVDGPDGIDVPE
jgi:hypothetical protein